MNVTSRLLQIVSTRGMTLAQLSRSSGVSYTVVYSAARGATPGPASRQKIEYALGVAPAELWGIDPTEAPHV